MVRQKCQQALWQIPALLIIASLMALLVNQVRPDGIQLMGDWATATRFSDADGESLGVTLDQAAQLLQKGEALFVDARPQDQFAQGHIAGALSLPWHYVDDHFMKTVKRLDEANVIITYCDGERCDLSHELALFLREMGFDRVLVLANGWILWQEAGLPIEGETPR
jgi:rhodanese-related sulfurtransferase